MPSLLQLTPPDIVFSELAQAASIPACFAVGNSSPNQVVLFKIKTTAPKRYLVKPASGMLSPSQKAEISVVYFPSGGEPADDKFQILSTTVAPGQSQEDAWKNAAAVKKNKMRVIFGSAPAPTDNSTNMSSSMLSSSTLASSVLSASAFSNSISLDKSVSENIGTDATSEKSSFLLAEVEKSSKTEVSTKVETTTVVSPPEEKKEPLLGDVNVERAKEDMEKYKKLAQQAEELLALKAQELKRTQQALEEAQKKIHGSQASPARIRDHQKRAEPVIEDTWNRIPWALVVLCLVLCIIVQWLVLG